MDSVIVRGIKVFPDDDDGFVEVAANLIENLELAEDNAVDHVFVIRIKNWFDHKWLGFSGKGRVAFDLSPAWHVGVALDEFRQDKLTFPPFTPTRVLSQLYWPPKDREAKKLPRRSPHPRVFEESSNNLHRRVEDFSKSLLAFWVSTNSSANGRASFMAYRSVDGSVDAWYASFRKDESQWTLNRVKGIERHRVEELMRPPP